MEVGEFDWRSGHVEHWDLGPITTERPLSDHYRWDLKEDLVLAWFPAEVCLGVGWFPEGRFDGRFVVQVIVEQNWSKPLMTCECMTVKDLARVISEAIDFADRFSLEKLSNRDM